MKLSSPSDMSLLLEVAVHSAWTQLLALLSTLGYGRFRMICSTVFVASMCCASSGDTYLA